MPDAHRYQGKPMLRLLECYVLRAIGSLGDNENATLVEMTPQLRAALKADGDWYQVIERAMQLPPNMPDLVRDVWEKNRKIADANRSVLSPQSFAEMFVDANLTGSG